MSILEHLLHSDILRVVFLILGLAPLCFLGYAIYNVYLHPLSIYPSSKFWGATYIPYALSFRKGNLVYCIEELHRKHGDIVRIGPNHLSFIKGEAWADIYGKKSAGRANFQKDPAIYRPMPNGVYSILGANDADHSRIRRILANAFSEKALHEQKPLLQKYVDLLIASVRVRAIAGEPIDISDWLNFTTFDIIGDLCYGESFNCLQSAAYHPWVTILFDFFKATALIYSALIALPGMAPIIQWTIPKKSIQGHIDHFNITKAKVHHRLEMGQIRPDFMTWVLRNNGDKGMSIEEIEATFALLAAAGAETTATALMGILFHLVKNRHVLERVTEEVRTRFDSEEDMTVENSGAKMPYLSAVIEEGLRMCPPVATGAQRVVPSGGAVVCGNWIPGGTIVQFSYWSAFRSPHRYHSPESFAPERWLHPSSPLSSNPYTNDDKSVHHPFSFGPRNCIGRNLAYLEMRLILGKMLWNFDFAEADEEGMKDWRDQKTFLLWERQGLRLRFSEKKDWGK